MSYRECIQVFHPVDVQAYLATLRAEFGALPHPHEADAFLIDNPPLPFYQPQILVDHLSILSFNYWPLSISLIEALLKHPELAPTNTQVLWTAEQDLVVAGTLAQVAQQLNH